MSKHFFQRFEQGYAGVKKTVTTACTLPFCNETSSKYKGAGSRLCEYHQSQLREYGGLARMDRPYTFHKKRICECCGLDPWKHPMVTQIDDELIRDSVARGMLIVDHLLTQRDGGCHSEHNVQTLCLNCNQMKTTLAGDSMPRSLYKNEQDYHAGIEKLRPYLEKLFG